MAKVVNINYENIPSGWVYIVSSNREIIECSVIKRAGGFTTLKFRNGGGVRLRDSRVFGSEIEAREYLRQVKEGK